MRPSRLARVWHAATAQERNQTQGSKGNETMTAQQHLDALVAILWAECDRNPTRRIKTTLRLLCNVDDLLTTKNKSTKMLDSSEPFAKPDNDDRARDDFASYVDSRQAYESRQNESGTGERKETTGQCSGPEEGEARECAPSLYFQLYGSCGNAQQDFDNAMNDLRDYLRNLPPIGEKP
jgi:hypothetical protein